MRIAVIALIVIAIAFAATAIWGAQGDGSGSDGCPSPPESDDPDVVAEWKPCGLAEGLGELMAPFAPGVDAAKGIVELSTRVKTRFVPALPAGDESIRIARVELVEGPGAHVEFACGTRECPKRACLCMPGESVAGLDLQVCGDRWRAKNIAGDRCAAKRIPRASLDVPPAGGELKLAPLGARAKIEVR